MKKVLIIAGFLFSSLAFAEYCNTYSFGSTKQTDCSNGNHYTTYNYGNSSTTYGRNKDGDSWSTNTYNSPSGSSSFGTNSQGSSWSSYQYRRP